MQAAELKAIKERVQCFPPWDTPIQLIADLEKLIAFAESVIDPPFDLVDRMRDNLLDVDVNVYFGCPDCEYEDEETIELTPAQQTAIVDAVLDALRK